MREREGDWRKYDLHSAVAAVLFHVRTPGVFEDQDLLTTMSYVCVMSSGQAKERFAILEKNLRPLLAY